MGFSSVIPDIVATVSGGIILALLFFFARERLFGFPEISGRWHFEIETLNTSYNPYKGMILRYVGVIWREGNNLNGTVEKIYEKSSTGEREYIGEDRTRGIISGNFEKNYFKKDKINLHIVEKGHGRESTNFHKLTVNSCCHMQGTFVSMVAEQSGTVKWQRDL